MVINLITFASLLHKQASVRSSHEIILNELEKYFTVNFIDYQDINKLSPDDFSILFIATGGVERLVIQHFEALPRPAIILADGMQNSLAAALEISSWLRSRGMKSEILHGELSEIIKRNFCTAQQFHGTTRPLRNAYRRDRHSVELAHCQQRGLSACQTTLGSGIHRHRTGTRVRILQPNHG